MFYHCLYFLYGFHVFYLIINVQFLVLDWVFVIEDDLLRYDVCVFLFCAVTENVRFFFSQTKTFL